MIRPALLVVLVLLPACAPINAGKLDRSYAGTVQKVYPVTLQGRDLPGIKWLGRVGSIIGPSLRKSSETNQYVVRIRTGQIMAQSDEQFSVGDCVEVIPQDNASSGPAFRYGQAQIVKSNECTTLTVGPG